MILYLLHDRHSLAEVASLKKAIEDLYGQYGVQVHDRGYFHVPFKEQRLDASRLLRYMVGVSGPEMCLWIVDEELFYPGRVRFSAAPPESTPSFPDPTWIKHF